MEMDVLFGSIDVRDLLSTPDSDESSPLSAPDLRLLIDRLNHRSLRIKDKVREYVIAHRRDFADIFARCADAATRADALSADLDSALRVLVDDPVDAEIRDLAVEIRNKRRALEERKEALAVVEVISMLVGRLGSARVDLREGRVVRAAEAVKELKGAVLVGEGDGGGDGEPVVYQLLRNEWTHFFDELQEVLAKTVEKAVQFDAAQGSVRVRSQLSMGEMCNVELREVLEALDTIGALDYGLAKVADIIVKHVMNPIISQCASVFIEGINDNSDKESKSDSILKLVQSTESQEKEKNIFIYSRLSQALKFIHKCICYENGRWMRCFGRLSWSRVSELVITHSLSKAVPDEASKLAEFQSIIKHTIEFEAFLKEINFISGTDGSDGKLSLFAHNVEVHFASRKRSEILAKARQLILQCDFIPSQENTVDLLLQPEKCIISKAANVLMELVHQTLEDVCLSSAKVAMEFYHAARDALLLYKAIVPVKLEKQLETFGQAAIIIHNDCLYLSQEITGLSFEYRADFPNFVREVAVFIDMAPYFRQLAEDIMLKQVQLASLNLKEAIDGGNGFQNTHQMQQFDLAKFSLDQVVFILEKVHIIWEPLLPKSTYKKSMCELLDSVFSRITDDILLLDDIAADETLQLQRLIQMALENLSSLIDSLHAAVSENNFSSSSLHLDEMLPSLRKLRKLADLLDMPLKSIITTWESGELIHCGFTALEVVNFIKAIFTDTPLRKDCLWRIEISSSS